MFRKIGFILLPLVTVLLACRGDSASQSAPATLPPTATTTPGVTAIASPSPSPQVSEDSAEDIVYYAAGTQDAPQLYALDYEGATTDQGHLAYRGSVVSRSGRWLALPAILDPRAAAASVIEVLDTETGRAHSIDLPPDFWLFGMTFDVAETRLALLALDWPDAQYTPWAYTIVDLVEGSTQRFANAENAREAGWPFPGAPLGWNASDTELLVDHFVPYSGGTSMGVSALAMPAEITTRPVTALARRQLLDAEMYAARPRLSADGRRLLYLARAEDYTPAHYDPIAYDQAVNQLWVMDTAEATTAARLRVNITDGRALSHVAAFAPDGERVLFAQGTYAGHAFESLTFHVYEGDGIAEIGPVPRISGAELIDLAWCRPTRAVALMRDAAKYTLYLVTLPAGDSVEVASAAHIELLGCVSPFLPAR